MSRKPGRMGQMGQRTISRTNEELADAELTLLLSTTVDWEKLRPLINDDATYNKLINVVQKSTTNNENLAHFKSRVVALGKAGWNVARKIIELTR
jgi:hypothetical protein